MDPKEIQAFNKRELVMRNDTHVLSFVMAGGNGNRLKILTKHRCKPALDIFGSYKIFDFVASNIVNTGIPVSLVATQFRPESLCPHIRETWCENGSNSKFEIINHNEEENNIIKFEGTADSIRKNISHIDKYNPDIILVLGADHIYFMNYEDAIIQHNTSNADITIMTNIIPDNKVSDFGIVKINEFGQIIDFAEKPVDKELIDSFRLNPGIKRCLGIEDPNLNFLASMGNYVFHWDRLKKFMDFPGVDFGKDIIPAIKANGGSLLAYVFNGYWRDVGKIQDYFDCNMEFTQKPMSLLRSWIGPREEDLPSPRVDDGSYIKRTILGSGNVISHKNKIENSVLGQNIFIEEGCTIDHCIILGADTDASTQVNKENNLDSGEVYFGNNTRIGEGSSLDYAILDKNVWIGKNVDIGPQNGTPDRRKKILQNLGLKPYKELDNGIIEGDFCIELDTGILVIGRQNNINHEKPILPDGIRC